MFKKKKLLQIAIDGTSGSGKSTIAKAIAKHYGIGYLSTGIIFRCFALALHKETNVDYSNQQIVKKVIKKVDLQFKQGNFFLNGKDVTNDVYQEAISSISSIISQYAFIRKKYEKITKKIIKNKSFVIEGRDIGTVILPNATYKFYLDADITIRAKRRVLQIKHTNLSNNPNQQSVTQNLKLRDERDKNRQLAALEIAKDAMVINTGDKSIKEIISLIINKISF